MYEPKKPINSINYSPNELSFITASPDEFSNLSSREVLVEVLAVALDQWDLNLICSMGASSRTIINPNLNQSRLQHEQKFRNSIVPGRSFFGKVIEIGKAVKKLRRGELVYGLQELSKSGALCGRIKVSSDYVARAPVILNKYQKACCGVSNSGSSSTTLDNRKQRAEHWSPIPLSSIEIASLPLLAVPAALIASTVCVGMPKGSKMLILNGHKGIGRMIVQLMRYFRPSRDLWITVHVPCTATGNLVDLEELVDQLEEEGATEVVTSESVLGLLHAQHESSFDIVLDTIGGQRIYDGSRRLLHHSGMFVTTIGPASTTSLSKSRFFRLRSLKRHFFKKDSKKIRYWQVTPADGFDGAHPEEIRTVLETISEWLSETEDPQQPLWDDFSLPGGVCWPVVGNVVERLEESLEIFEESLAVTRDGSNAIPGRRLPVLLCRNWFLMELRYQSH
ncbi:hypothetical protein PCASD_02972 [Puccinia coronata f. sp. avenae]|uniref:Uncharacterized protein n=1 Tax=Puccinia coronata f. sp. avenae TaxID=200324 RepID=A0A2N5VGM1_9BASI|nr:hypothetical protein PCASD_02972 [Puccinia coronata f. sp. avenae]